MGDDDRRRAILRRCLRKAGYKGSPKIRGEAAYQEGYRDAKAYLEAGKEIERMSSRLGDKIGNAYRRGWNAAIETGPTTKFPYLIYVGLIETMELVAKRGVKVLNPRTMKYQTVSKTAKYSVVPDPDIHGGATLYSNEDLKKIAEEKGLVWG